MRRTSLPNYTARQPGILDKIFHPTIADGKGYAATEDSLVLFGLLVSPGIGLIMNAAGYQTGGVAPGPIVSVFGTNLAADANR
jgi:hypothetical protein